jgi:hypothetical protein
MTGSLGFAQVPMARQRNAVRSVAVTHSLECAAQLITPHAGSSPSDGNWVQPPAPSQTRQVSQRVPAGGAMQVPTEPGCVQDSQPPVHDRSQHTPLAQCPDPHASSDAQVCPIPSRAVVHAPAMQASPPTQPLAPLQLAGHAVPTPSQT